MDSPSIKGHRLLRTLGEGGMGRVYLAEDEILGRRVAIKVISERHAIDEAARARFLREARSMATVEHPNVVRVYAFGETGHTAYLVMEYVEGEMLATRLSRGRLAVDEALRITREVVDALDAAWAKNVVHRDVKPSNILLDRKGRVRVADFGLAKPVELASDPSLTATGSILGTPQYVSPEQARGRDVDFRTDVYAAGIVLYEMLVGHRPYDGATPLEVVAKHLHGSLPSPAEQRPDLPPSVVELVAWMTAKDSAERPPSYAALRTRLDEIRAETADLTEAATLTGPPRRQSGRPSWRSRMPMALAGLVILTAAISFWCSRPVTRPPRDARLAVLVAPFYGPDAESAREGRMMAALVERAIAQRLPRADVRIVGIEGTKQPVRDDASARALAARFGADVVVWGDCYILGGETEIQPYFTMVVPTTVLGETERRRAIGGDPLAALQERAGRSLVLGAQAPNQIEARKIGAAGVGDLVLLLAGVHALYFEGKPQKALALLDQAPKTSETLRYRAEALLQLLQVGEALQALEEATVLSPEDAQAWGALGDLHMEAGRLAEAVTAYGRAAEVGSRYSTRAAILFEGELYEKETFPSGRADDPIWESGYLLGVDPRTGVVRDRRHIGGMVRSFHPGARGLEVTYWDGGGNLLVSSFGADETAILAGGSFDRPLALGSLIVRRRGVIAGLALAANFMPPGPEEDFKPRGVREDAPRTFSELEAALRQARKRDPTQPWHLFLQGQAAWWQGRRDEAAAVWKEMFAGAYRETPYYEYAWMAFEYERFGQREWAERAFDESLTRRRRLPQPIDAATLIERLINAPFLTEAARRLSNGRATSLEYERAHEWLVRARTLAPVFEVGDFVAAAWARHYRDRGEAEKAAAETAYRDRTEQAALNGPQAAGRWDEELLALLGLSLALWGSLAVLLGLAKRRRKASSPGPAAGFAQLAPLGWLTRPERHALLSLGALVMLVYVALASGLGRFEALSELPIGFGDSLGSPGIVDALEARLADAPSDPMRFLVAVANQLAGHLDRAHELYRGLPDDPRARKNLEAMAAGRLVLPEAPTAEDIAAAYATLPWSRRIRSLWTLPAIARDLQVAEGPFVLVAVDALAVLTLLIALLVVPKRGEGASPAALRGGAEGWSLPQRLIPGLADLARGAPGRGALALTLFTFAGASVVALVSGSRLGTELPTFGPMTASWSQTISRLFPVPSLPYWPLFWTYRDAAWFWGAVALSGVASLLLHGAAKRLSRGS